MSTLLLRLAAPMQSWGADAKFDRRGTERAPTKSAVAGLLAAALGRRRNEDIADLGALRFGVRVDKPGKLLRDYHTAHPEKGTSFLSQRYYLADAVFLVGLEGSDDFLQTLAQALENPVFPLFLGRRSCPPEGQLVLGVVPEALQEVLQTYPALKEAQGRRDIYIDADAADAASVSVVRDMPQSFDQAQRRFGFRRVAALVCTAEPATRHDPLAEMEV